MYQCNMKAHGHKMISKLKFQFQPFHIILLFTARPSASGHSLHCVINGRRAMHVMHIHDVGDIKIRTQTTLELTEVTDKQVFVQSPW